MKKGIKIIAAAVAIITVLITIDRIPAIYYRLLSESEQEKTSSDSSHGGILALVNSSHKYVDTGEEKVRLYDKKSDSFFLSTSEIYLDKRAVEPLCKMLDDFKNTTGLRTINVISGARSVQSQKDIYNEKQLKYGYLYTKKFVQAPGFSEHHTGLAVDLALFNSEDGTSEDFDGKGKYSWIIENAWKYGFILRYPEDKKSITGIGYEPWHLRYVGIPHAYYISKNGLCLEEYIDLLQSKSQSEPLKIAVGKRTYKVWHCESKPKKASFSGDNCGGYIAWK